MALNALSRTPPLNWVGGIATDEHGCIDLKLQGTAVFVDAARIYGLVHGVTSTNTRERLMAIGPLLGVAAAEYEAWVRGFEFLQMQRLQLDYER